MVAGGTATAGSLTRWFRDELAPAELAAERAGGPNAYEALAAPGRLLPPAPAAWWRCPTSPGSARPLHDPEAKGMIFGLTLSHTRADLYRALLESVGYSIRHNIEALAEAGCRAERILAVGGGTRNAAWMQMVSDIAGIRQLVPEQQIGASYGDAFLAGVGVGLFGGLEDVRRWVRLKETIEPDPAAHALYGGYYRLYRGLYERNAAAMRDLSVMARRQPEPRGP